MYHIGPPFRCFENISDPKQGGSAAWSGISRQRRGSIERLFDVKTPLLYIKSAAKNGGTL